MVRQFLFAGFIAGALLAPQAALAQDSGEAKRKPEGVEEITVTGSLIKRTATDGPQPVTVIDAAQLENLAVLSPIEVLDKVSANSGSEFRSDAFTSGGTYGTANVNLRGLGLGTTLVLVDGRRQVVSGTTSNDGSSFVDINNFPLGMIERVEILKEGAAATYGSDAVAGVVNFITKKDATGFDLFANYDTSDSDHQINQEIGGLWGWTDADEKNHVQFFANFSDRNQLQARHRDFTRSKRDENGFLITNRGNSAFGNPGAFAALADIQPGQMIVPGVSTTDLRALQDQARLLDPSPSPVPTAQNFRLRDPGCAGARGTPNPGAAAGLGPCNFEFVDNFDLAEHEKRMQYAASFRHDFSEALTAEFKWNYSMNKQDDIGLSPSFPILDFAANARVPANNPGNPTGVPVIFFGRPLAENSPTARGFYYSRYNDWQAGLKGEINDDWDWDLHYTFQKQRRYQNVADTNAANLRAAFAGFGGVNCDPATGQPGVGDCLFFNPFSSAILNAGETNSRGQALANDPEVIEFITRRIKDNTDTELQVIDAVMTGQLAELPAGPLGVAFGYQYRRDGYKLRSNSGPGEIDFNEFIFLTGTPEFDKVRSTTALFAEAQVPVFDNLEAQLAVRFEDYNGGIGSSVDPKLGVRWQATEWLAFRSSVSTTFRAPTLSQVASFRTAQEAITDGPRGFGFRAVTSRGNGSLQPEEADAYNAGAILSFEGFEATLDYFRIDLSEVIVQEQPQPLVDAENQLNAGGTIDCNNAAFRPLLTQSGEIAIQRNSACAVTRILADFRNAPSIVTDGLDLGINLSRDTAFGTFTLYSTITHLIQYDIKGQGFCADVNAGSCKAAGSLNNLNFARPLPKWRGNMTLGLGRGDHFGGITFNFIGSYDDDNNANRRIRDDNSVDLTYRWRLPLENYDTFLQVGVRDLFNREPPFSTATDFNYDTRTHDPIGRRFFVNLRTRF
jgi:iron complex outermembrane recepter protein